EDRFTVVHDPFLSVTARYADIVLPAATYLETEDFYRAYGAYYMQYGHRAVAPFGQARSNLEVAQALAARLGLQDPVFRMSQDEMLQELFRGATGTVEHVDPKSIRDAGPINIAPTRRPWPAPSTCSAPTATPTWATARPTRAPISTWRRGRRDTESD